MSNYLQDAIDGAQGVKDVAAGAQRVPFDYSKIPTDFLNGEDIDNPDGDGDTNIDASAGDNKGTDAEEIEFIHFGRVYRDGESWFDHEEYDDDANIDMAEVIGGRAGMFRAALMRETLLQAGYLHALRWAMEEASKQPPTEDGSTPDGMRMIDKLLGMVGDLFGGDAAGQLHASSLDVNPLVSQCNGIGNQLNVSPISYPDLHRAGRDLHELRCKYRAFLEEQNETTPTPAKPPAGLLGGLPLIGDALKEIPVVGDVLKWGDKIMGCSFQLVGRMTVEMHLKMEPSVNAAVRDISLDAIRNRRAPVFKPWWKYGPPQPAADGGDGDDGGGDDGDGMSVDFVELAKEQVDPTLQKIDDQVEEYTSLFTRPDASTPGDGFIGQAFFLNPQGSPLDRSEKMAGYGAAALTRVVAGAEGADTSFSMPPIVTDIATYIFQLVTEFIRSVYEKLLVVGEDRVQPHELAEAGRTHLVKSLTDWPLKAFDLNKYLDFVNQPIPSLSGGDPVMLSTRSLFENLRDMLIEQLGFMDVAVDFAMKSFHELLDKMRGELMGDDTLAMEPYLALIPTLHATMFRNLLLPFWSAMQKAVKGALGQVLAPVMDQLGAGGFMGDVFDAVDTGQQIAQRAKDAVDLISGPGGVGTHNYQEVGKLARGLDDPNTTQAFGGNGGSHAPLNPFGSRKTKVSAEPIDAAQRDEVKPDLKWKPDAGFNEAPGQTEPPPPQGNGGTP